MVYWLAHFTLTHVQRVYCCASFGSSRYVYMEDVCSVARKSKPLSAIIIKSY